MIENKEWPVEFAGECFAGIEQLGFNEQGKFIVSLFPLPPPAPRGGYFTVPPVSSLKSRRQHGNGRLAFIDEGSAFVLIDEQGQPYRFGACRRVIDQLVSEAIAYEVPALSMRRAR